MHHRAHPALLAHAAQFTQSFHEIGPGIWTAVGFAESNVHVIEGREGLVVIDTTESVKAAEAVMSEVRARTQKPVRTIIYTHGHRDHIGGALAFAEADPEIIAAESFHPEIAVLNGSSNVPMPSANRLRRTRRTTGAQLPPKQQISVGCGPVSPAPEYRGEGYIPPSRTISEAVELLERDGLRLELHRAPGKSHDHIVVWHPEARTLFCGDLYHNAFPDLSSIRGSGTRDFETWARSLDRLIAFEAEALAPGHTRPVTGRDEVREVLSDYRAAIRHIILTCVEGLNAGRSVDELAHSIKLPKALATKPHLQEVHGRVDWAVRAFAQSAVGWFDGNPTNLSRLAPTEEARRVIALAGGARAVLTAAEETDDPQWAMELCDRLIASGEFLADARALKHACLQVLGEAETNAIARNYYLSCALEMDV